ncbi:periphilin-1-like isoform X2 [Dendropsophus ebraccatus]|uniref:periphilin-1-like isoform X2 n=1 Tax=Dendropsophus ebraccatus TaxID=150705 RepID=UPI0038316B07
MAHWPGPEEMYHSAGDRGWHRGHHQRDIPPPRNHRSRPYRGGYHEHRDHDNYGSYHDNHCHDRSYNDSQFMEYSDHSYKEFYEENQSFNDYREHREPVYNRGGRHDSGYHKETYYRGAYQRGRGESARYRGHVSATPPKKYSHKTVKSYKKENEIRVKNSTPQPAEKVIHNPGRTIVTLTPGITEDAGETKSSKAPSPEKDARPSQDCEKTSPQAAKLESVKKDVKVESTVKEILTAPSDHRNEAPTVCDIKTETTDTKKEDTLRSEHFIKEEVVPVRVNPGKRAHSEEKDVGVEQREGESFVGKRLCSNQDRGEDYLEKTDQIPLLGCWVDMPSESMVSSSISEQENTGPAVNCLLSDTARELRTAFILARKEQIEVAFAQDCKTFAFVASTLLKKDPSMEAAVTTALRSTLQEMAGVCVQQLNNFIDHYDSENYATQ